MIPLSLRKNYWFKILNYVILFVIIIMEWKFDFQIGRISYRISIDIMSFFLIILTVWICILIIIAREKVFKIKLNIEIFSIVLLILIIGLVLVFIITNLFIFYLFFEIRLIPVLILIIGWGYQPERLQARIYLLFYTLLGSLPIIISIFNLYKERYRLEFFLLVNLDYIYLYIFIIIVFLVKIPIYLVHLWLPKAHVEASVAGSIILAGIILKLGGYGLIRLVNFFNCRFINTIVIVIGLVRGVLVSFICIRQIDVKSLIAYSSVSHIGLAVVGVITINLWGFIGALVVMLAHGLCSSGLFCLANLSYERIESRVLLLNKGMLTIIPMLSFWWFLFLVCNISAPPSLNLLGEIFLIASVLRWRFYRIFFLRLILFLVGAYCLYLYSFRQHGKFYFGVFVIGGRLLRENILLLFHFYPLILLFIKRDIFINMVYLNSL